MSSCPQNSHTWCTLQAHFHFNRNSHAILCLKYLYANIHKSHANVTFLKQRVKGGTRYQEETDSYGWIYNWNSCKWVWSMYWIHVPSEFKIANCMHLANEVQMGLYTIFREILRNSFNFLRFSHCDEISWDEMYYMTECKTPWTRTLKIVELLYKFLWMFWTRKKH